MVPNLTNRVLEILADKNKVLRPKNIFDLLDPIKGAKMLSLVTLTEPKLAGGKSGPFYEKILHLANPSAQINFDYENAVNNARRREGSESDFEAGETWYTVVTDEKGRLTPWARHKKTNELYLRYRHLQTNASVYIDKITGNSIPIDALRPYLKSSVSKTQGLEENQVYPRTVKLSNVIAVAVDGEVYVNSETGKL